ncbi:MAG: hypothetical protein ACI9DH_001514 [Halioglobus sp.]|jgi:hypothetical protein
MDSNQYETVVQRRHVRRREFQVLLALLFTVILLAAGFYLGQRSAYSGMGIDPEAYREMERAVPEAAVQLQKLEESLDISGTRNEVDRASLELVRKEIAAQNEEILRLEESLTFYQSLMSPGDIAKGLTLRPIELIATESEHRFAFRIIARQESRKHRLLKGTLSVKVEGVTNQKESTLSLSALSEEIESDSIALRFRYFQTLEGELELPEGFEPKTVSIVARSASPVKVEIVEQFPWSIQERFTYVGK